MKLKYLTVQVIDFKYDSSTGEFECYGNTKNNIDHVRDRPLDGCYTKSIERHRTNKTMPSMLWSHNPNLLPVGTWKSMGEDAIGLRMGGKMSKSTMGSDIEILAKENGLNAFSIGYIEVESKWNQKDECNDLIELDIREVSWVNFGCDENATLQGIKSHLDDGELPTKSELTDLLTSDGLTAKQAEKIVNCYNPEIEAEYKVLDIFEQMALVP